MLELAQGAPLHTNPALRTNRMQEPEGERGRHCMASSQLTH
jgi:hypothetical protein